MYKLSNQFSLPFTQTYRENLIFQIFWRYRKFRMYTGDLVKTSKIYDIFWEIFGMLYQKFIIFQYFVPRISQFPVLLFTNIITRYFEIFSSYYHIKKFERPKRRGGRPKRPFQEGWLSTDGDWMLWPWMMSFRHRI